MVFYLYSFVCNAHPCVSSIFV